MISGQWSVVSGQYGDRCCPLGSVTPSCPSIVGSGLLMTETVLLDTNNRDIAAAIDCVSDDALGRSSGSQGHLADKVTRQIRSSGREGHQAAKVSRQPRSSGSQG